MENHHSKYYSVSRNLEPSGSPLGRRQAPVSRSIIVLRSPLPRSARMLTPDMYVGPAR